MFLASGFMGLGLFPIFILVFSSAAQGDRRGTVAVATHRLHYFFSIFHFLFSTESGGRRRGGSPEDYQGV